MCAEDKACNNRTRIRAGRHRQEPGIKTEAPRDGSDTGSSKIKHEESQIRSAATKVNWKHTREARSRCIVSRGCTPAVGKRNKGRSDEERSRSGSCP